MAEVNVVRTLNHASLNTKVMIMMMTDLTVKKMMRNTTMKKLKDPDVLEAEGTADNQIETVEDKGKRLGPQLKRGRF